MRPFGRDRLSSLERPTYWDKRNFGMKSHVLTRWTVLCVLVALSLIACRSNPTPTPPSQDKLTNWLPAPKGDFSLYVRSYWPEDAILNGQWTPPAVLKVK